VGEFLSNAESLLEAAAGMREAGGAPSEMAILIGSDGAIRILAGNDWPLRSLQLEHGAKMAFRVSRHPSAVRVEGRTPGRSCVLEMPAPAWVAPPAARRFPRLLSGGCC